VFYAVYKIVAIYKTRFETKFVTNRMPYILCDVVNQLRLGLVKLYINLYSFYVVNTAVRSRDIPAVKGHAEL